MKSVTKLIFPREFINMFANGNCKEPTFKLHSVVLQGTTYIYELHKSLYNIGITVDVDPD